MKYLLFFLLPFFNQTIEKIKWTSPQIHDFGIISTGMYMKHDFEFINNTNDVLTIDNVRTTCECTAADWEEEVITPGKSSSIKVVFHTLNPGYYKKKIKVYFSKIKKPYELVIETEVE
jgi:Protein of unknown function (DUF1573)